MVHVLQFPVEPHVDVDHGYALQFLDLVEKRHDPPLFGHHAFHDIHRHRADVLIRHDCFAADHFQVLHAPVVVQNELLDALFHAHVPAKRFDVRRLD